MSFSDFSLSPELHRSIKDRGYDEPTPIQESTIPVALKGKDLIATAETGSGKTAAFLLPMIERLHAKIGAGHKLSPASALILTPTRELAAQIAREFGLLARHCRLRAALIVGGDSMSRQLQDLRAGAHVLIACPGRLNDHLERGTVKLDRIEMVVLDEADRMLDMGFLPQLRRIMRTVPRQRQTLMFSATMAAGVGVVAREFLQHPERIEVGEKAAPPVSIRQTIFPCTQDSKPSMLLELLSREEVESAIVFTRTRSRAERVGKYLARNGVKAAVIHGDRSQGQRNAALSGFRSRQFRVMVATDVASRGLDIPHVSHVINYDLPEESDNYIHRIGRTARMGRAGDAFSLVTPEERGSLGRLERSLGNKIEREHVEGFEVPELTTPKPVTIFRSSRMRRSNHRRASWG